MLEAGPAMSSRSEPWGSESATGQGQRLDGENRKRKGIPTDRARQSEEKPRGEEKRINTSCKFNLFQSGI